jgi:hypothetical protein
MAPGVPQSARIQTSKGSRRKGIQMKGVIIAAVLIGIVVFFSSMMMTGEITKDQGYMLAIAYGVPVGDKIQFHLGVGPSLINIDPPEIGDKKSISWSEWSDQHFTLRDDAGNKIPLQRMGTSSLMMHDKAAGSPDFILWADLKKNADYSCDYIPVARTGKRYRHSFTCPSEPTKTGRYQFDPAPEEE